MRELRVVGVRVELPTNQPIVLLKEIGGERFLPIWIGAVEATAIAYEQQGITPDRPLTHDLMRDVLTALDIELVAVEINDIRDTIFFADLVFASDVRVSARPSDAIALALRTGATVRCTEEVLAASGITMSEASDDEVEKFREFLDNVTPEDFAE
ncbi:bifunctional nuclease family protein [Stackebrandtia soli]|uniref:bifunctional nuclease family protein n=1 Tax=Stackebrandtia soli TaxID=1892856 RepID=UPI0039E78AAE